MILLECAIQVGELLGALNEGNNLIFHYAPNRAEAPEESIKFNSKRTGRARRRLVQL